MMMDLCRCFPATLKQVREPSVSTSENTGTKRLALGKFFNSFRTPWAQSRYHVRFCRTLRHRARELQNVVERAVILCDGDTLEVDKAWLQRESPKGAVATRGLGRPNENQEKEIIESALRECQGRVSGPLGAAAKLGIPRSTLESRIRILRINKHHFKKSA